MQQINFVLFLPIFARLIVNCIEIYNIVPYQILKLITKCINALQNLRQKVNKFIIILLLVPQEDKNLHTQNSKDSKNISNLLKKSQEDHFVMDQKGELKWKQNSVLLQQDDSLQKKRRKSFSPMKSLKLLQTNQLKNLQLEEPPVLISSYMPEQKQQNKKPSIQQNPITYLLQYQTSKGNHTLNKRSQQEISLIMKLIEGNKLWEDLGFCEGDSLSSGLSSNKINEQMIRDICNSIVLVWSQIPNITDTKSNEVYLILEGKTFEYVHNENENIKLKIHENNDYIMIRKLIQNDYFLSLSQGRYKHKSYQNISEKYQLMVDEKTLMGKISDELYSKYIQKKLTERVRDLTNFMKRIVLFQNLPEVVFQQLSKFIKLKRVKQNEEIIRQKEKSKELYFIKKGSVQFKVHIDQNHSDSKETEKTQILRQYDVFGMDTLHTVKKIDKILQFSARSITDCELYYIDKRILAIVISSFQKEFKAKQRIVKSIDINAQIKGQNYISKKQQILNENVQRIKTSQKKIRDVKLLNYSPNKQRKINTYIPEKDRVKQRTVQIKTNDKKLRTSAGFNLIRNKSIKSQSSLLNLRQSTDSNLWSLKKTLSSKYAQNLKLNQGVQYNKMILPVLQEQDVGKKTLTLFSNQSYNEFENLNKKSLQIFTPSLLGDDQKKKINFGSTVKSFVPKVQSRASMYEIRSHSGKIQSELMKNYIEKKIKQEVVKKAQDILDMKNNSQRSSIKNIKKFYNKNSFSPSKKIVQTARTEHMTRKQLTDELFDRMANIKNSPLLSLIQSERKKMQSQQKKFKKENKVQTLKQEILQNDQIKARFNQTKILFTSSELSVSRQLNKNELNHPISYFESNFNTSQN